MPHGISLAMLSVCVWAGAACGAHQAQDTRPSLDEVLRYLRSTSALDHASGCLMIQGGTWSPEEAEPIVGELSRMIVAYSDVSFALRAVEHLAQSHPRECEPALNAMNKAISERLRPSDWHRQREACDIVRTLGEFGPRASFAARNLEEIVRREQEFPFVAIYAAAALTRIRATSNNRTLVDWLSERLVGERSTVAALALGDAGPSAGVAVPTLSRLVERGSPAERVVAAAAIWKLEGVPPDNVLNTLFGAIGESPVELRLVPDGISATGITHSLYAGSFLASRSAPNDPIHQRLVALRAHAKDPAQQRLLDEAIRRINARKQSNSAPSESAPPTSSEVKTDSPSETGPHQSALPLQK